MRQLYALLLTLALFSGCKKTSSTGTNTSGNDDGPPDITAVGTPAGNPTDPNGNVGTIQGTTASFPEAFAFLYDSATTTVTEFIDPYKGTARDGLLTGTIKRLP